MKLGALALGAAAAGASAYGAVAVARLAIGRAAIKRLEIAGLLRELEALRRHPRGVLTQRFPSSTARTTSSMRSSASVATSRTSPQCR
jgi:hypothetical protein